MATAPRVDEIRLGLAAEASEPSLARQIALLREENASLHRIIGAVGSTLQLEEVLRHVVAEVTHIAQGRDAFVYLYHPEKEVIRLAATTPAYSRFVGQIELALGEGINGWVALNGQPVMIPEGAMHDPRYRYFPELEEEKFQSMMSVPIFGKQRQLLGVLCLHTVAPHEFSQEDLQHITSIAALVAGAIENAQLYEATRRKLNALAALASASQTISSSLQLDDVLRSMASLTRQITESDLCVVLLLDSERKRLSVGAMAPGGDRAETPGLALDSQRLAALTAMAGPRATGVGEPPGWLAELNPLRGEAFGSVLSAPLVAGSEHLGLVNCYTRKPRRYSSEDLSLLATIANQLAVAIKNHQLLDLLAEKNLVRGFFAELMAGSYESEEAVSRRGAFLGCDLGRPHVVALVCLRPADSVPGGERGLRRAAQQVRRSLADRFPGTLCYDEREDRLWSLVPTRGEGAEVVALLRGLAREMARTLGAGLAGGVSSPCATPAEYRQGFAEAREALEIGGALGRGDGVAHFSELGIYRHLFKLASQDDLRDPCQAEILRLAEHDRTRGTELLVTLERYIECAGNLARTADLLHIHRNTLVQRLDRIRAVASIDPHNSSDWLRLNLAIKLYRLRPRASGR